MVYSECEYILSTDDAADELTTCGSDDDDTIVLPLSAADKLDDGTITESGLQKLNANTWHDYPWDCYECGERLRTVTELRTHSTSAHDNAANYFCVDCSKLFDKYTRFIRHVRHMHRIYLRFW